MKSQNRVKTRCFLSAINIHLGFLCFLYSWALHMDALSLASKASSIATRKASVLVGGDWIFVSSTRTSVCKAFFVGAHTLDVYLLCMSLKPNLWNENGFMSSLQDSAMFGFILVNLTLCSCSLCVSVAWKKRSRRSPFSLQQYSHTLQRTEVPRILMNTFLRAYSSYTQLQQRFWASSSSMFWNVFVSNGSARGVNYDFVSVMRSSLCSASSTEARFHTKT